jgi:hypothetical protein
MELVDWLLSYKVAVKNPEENTDPLGALNFEDNTKIHIKTGHVGVSWMKPV